MRPPACILVVDDNPANIDIIETRLATQGYRIVTAVDGEDALAKAREHKPDVILLDVMMPKKDGLEVCRELKADPTLPFTPIILVTAKGDTKDVIAGLESGGDEYLTKPVDTAALLARVRSILRVKELHDQVQSQARQLAEWNQSLEARVAEQIGEIERMTRLKRFLPPQVAEIVMSSGAEALLASHRREVTVVFCDLRGFTAFAEASEPEEVMTVLRDYHQALGALIVEHEGTLERFAGDGLLVVFNDPIECSEHTERAVNMAITMRERIGELAETWRRQGHDLGFGVGIARGFATLGQIGFDRRVDYAAIGTVSNLAARLCGEAKAGQILVSQKVATIAGSIAETGLVGDMLLKGFARAVSVYEILRRREAAAAN
ncbi:MAG TPA: response regulator [Alphaproteobacteria bacterium]|nr:response regulator [Alphaproteobacteria bacterium]